MTIRWRPLLRWTGAACLALAVWLAAMVALTVAAEPTRSVIVFAPDRSAMIKAVTGADVRLLDGSDRLLSVTGASPGFVARLYAGGAWLVLPARTSGCITPPLRAAARNPARG